MFSSTFGFGKKTVSTPTPTYKVGGTETKSDILTSITQEVNEIADDLENKTPQSVTDAIIKMRKKVFNKYGEEGLTETDKIISNKFKKNKIYSAAIEQAISEKPNTGGIKIITQTEQKLASKTASFIENIKNLDPDTGNILTKLFKRWARWTFLNPKDAGIEGTLSSKYTGANWFAKQLRKMIPETRNKKVAAQLIILAGLATGLAYLVKLHQTHHVISKKNNHKHNHHLAE